MLKPILLILMMSTLMGCFSASTIDADEEGVLIYKPWVFGAGGVDPTPITTGLTWTVWSTQVERFKIVPIRYDEEFSDVITDDGTPVSFDGYLTLKVQEGKTPILLTTGGVEWYYNNVSKTFRALLRDTASTYTVEDLSGDADTRNQLKATVAEQVTAHIAEVELPLDVVEVEIGKILPPREVLAETERTAAAAQRVKSEDSLKLAEDARRERENSRAAADKEYMNEMGFSPDQYLVSRSIEIEREKLEIVKNKDNVTVILASGDGSSPVPVFGVGTQ